MGFWHPPPRETRHFAQKLEKKSLIKGFIEIYYKEVRGKKLKFVPRNVWNWLVLLVLLLYPTIQLALALLAFEDGSWFWWFLILGLLLPFFFTGRDWERKRWYKSRYFHYLLCYGIVIDFQPKGVGRHWGLNIGIAYCIASTIVLLTQSVPLSTIVSMIFLTALYAKIQVDLVTYQDDLASIAVIMKRVSPNELATLSIVRERALYSYIHEKNLYFKNSDFSKASESVKKNKLAFDVDEFVKFFNEGKENTTQRFVKPAIGLNLFFPDPPLETNLPLEV